MKINRMLITVLGTILLTVCGLASAHVKVAVVRSWGSVPVFAELNDNWQAYGTVPLTIDTSLMGASSFTYHDLVNTGADVLWISDPAGGGEQYSAVQIDAVRQYVSEGHSILGTYMVFQYGGIDNRGLAPVFGLREDIVYNTAQLSASQVFDLLVGHPLFCNVPDPYVSSGWPNAQAPADDFTWDLDDFGTAQLLAQTDDKRGVVTWYQTPSYHAIFVSEMVEHQGNPSDTQFLYNALTVREPAIIYVDADATGNNDGSSWADGFNDLQDALATAQYGEEIRVAQGVYKPAAGYTPPPPPPMDSSSGQNAIATAVDREATFQLINGVTIKGGYAGFGEPDANERDIDAYETILSGDIGIVGDSWDNSYHIVTGSGTDANAILDGFTISGGNANSHYGQDRDNGSGMYNVNGNPSVRSCTFSLNAANRFGGGMYNYESNPMLSYCTFRLNYGRVGGGGIYNDYASNPTIVDCTFQENSTNGFGGGIDNVSESSPTLINCMLTGNSSEGYGAGVSMSRSSPTLIGCTLAANSAILGGGGFHCYWSSNLTLINCTLSANSAPNGSAVACRRQDGPSHLQLTNCIIWGDGSEIWNNNDSVITITYTDVQGGWPDEGNIDADPCFADPGYWGHRDDPNIIVEPNDPNALWVYGDYHLLPDSPCIDAGDPNYAAEPNETDLDGKPRVIGGRIDMGAYEYPNTTPVACMVDGNRIVECGGCWGARVTLDGSCSSDSDSAPGTNDDIVSFDWYKVDACDPNFEDFLASGEIIDCNLPLGEHIIVLEVTDKAGAFDTNEVTIVVQDTTPPEFTLSVTPTMLWPANHKMVLIRPTWTVSDICDASPEVSLVSITMNEGDEAKGDGHTTLNIQISDDGSIYLRAERSGTGSGRIYTITYQAVDDSGNVAVASATVTVPHDQR